MLFWTEYRACRPVGWLGNPDVANLAVIASGIWIWTGFSMVVLSAAYKSLPKDVLESATVDGATRVIGFTVFWEMFNNQKLGYGSAVAVILFTLITPFIIIQIRNVRAEVR